EERGDRACGVAGCVRVRGGGGALARLDNGDHVRLTRGDVHLREREAREEERDRGCEVRRECHGYEEHVRGQGREYHRPEQAEALRESYRDLKRERLQQSDREEDERERVRRGTVLAREQVGDE